MWRGSQRQTRRAHEKTRALDTSARSTIARHTKRTRARAASKRSRRLGMWLTGAAFLVVLIVAGLSWLSYSDRLAVTEVTIEGNSAVDTRDIEALLAAHTAPALLGIFSQRSIITYPAAVLERELLAAFATIADVTIRRELLDRTVRVAITERAPYARWCESTRHAECYLIDSNGFIYARATLFDPESFVFTNGVSAERALPIREHVAPEYFRDAVLFITELAALDVSAVALRFEEPDAYLTTAAGWELRVALDDDFEATLLNMTAVLDEHGLRERQSELAYIDMRFDERVYYALTRDVSGQEAATVQQDAQQAPKPEPEPATQPEPAPEPQQ